MNSMISLRKPLQLLQNRRNLSRRQLVAQTVHHKPINHLQRVDMLKAYADGSIVITLARLTLTILQAHYNSARSKDGSIVEQKFYGLFEQKKNHKAVSMVITLTQGLTLTILQAQSTRSRPYSVHYSRGKSAHYNS